MTDMDDAQTKAYAIIGRNAVEAPASFLRVHIARLAAAQFLAQSIELHTASLVRRVYGPRRPADIEPGHLGYLDDGMTAIEASLVAIMRDVEALNRAVG